VKGQGSRAGNFFNWDRVYIAGCAARRRARKFKNSSHQKLAIPYAYKTRSGPGPRDILTGPIISLSANEKSFRWMKAHVVAKFGRRASRFRCIPFRQHGGERAAGKGRGAASTGSSPAGGLWPGNYRLKQGPRRPAPPLYIPVHTARGDGLFEGGGDLSAGRATPKPRWTLPRSKTAGSSATFHFISWRQKET